MRQAKRALFFAPAACALVLFFVIVSRHATAEPHPYVPADDSVVLERLAAGRSDAKTRELDEMRRALGFNPGDLRLAVRVAKRDIELARERSDPRYLGHAEAALGPWYKLEVPPHEVVVLRATIRQSNHDFTGALADLDLAASQRWDDPQVWLTKAVVLTVRADYARARDACDKLRALSQPFAAAVCAAGIDAVTGRAAHAYDELSRVIATSPDDTERTWATSVLAEVALRKGDLQAAETHFKAVLAVDPADAYVLGALADLYLDLGRGAEAIPMLHGKTENDALLLRLALAERATKASDAPAHAEMLRARYDASRARGDVVHRREQARFALFIDGDATAALTLAVANFEVQREPADARILLEAARAAAAPKAAAPAVAWVDDNHVEDPRLRALANEVR